MDDDGGWWGVLSNRLIIPADLEPHSAQTHHMAHAAAAAVYRQSYN